MISSHRAAASDPSSLPAERLARSLHAAFLVADQQRRHRFSLVAPTGSRASHFDLSIRSDRFGATSIRFRIAPFFVRTRCGDSGGNEVVLG